MDAMSSRGRASLTKSETKPLILLAEGRYVGENLECGEEKACSLEWLQVVCRLIPACGAIVQRIEWQIPILLM